MTELSAFTADQLAKKVRRCVLTGRGRSVQERIEADDHLAELVRRASERDEYKQAADAEAQLADDYKAERDRAVKERDDWNEQYEQADKTANTEHHRRQAAEAEARRLRDALKQITQMKPEKGAKLDRAVEIARAALAERGDK